MVLVLMSWVIIAKPTAYILWVLIMIAFVVWSNYKAMIDTAKKLLNRA